MIRYVVAVSGGVDSVVLLDMLSKCNDLDLVVAHFDHGIRPESAKDSEFVRELAKKYGFKFKNRREELGSGASEELARNRRYKFLREIAKKYDAKVVTAHHADDIVETIAINLVRGTGWRGLSVMGSDVVRPLATMTKAELIQYAMSHNLEWREDSTNRSEDYLRNKIRRKTMALDMDTKRQLLALWAAQTELRAQIDNEVNSLIGAGPEYSRYFLSHINESAALEVLRHITKQKLTRPQMMKVWHAIKTIKSGKVLQAGSGVKILFTTRNFKVELLK